jgi:hypothetical protein
MKNFLILFFILSGVSLVNAQATATFTASATIIEPIGITTTSNMHFASLDAGSGGSVILSPEDQRLATGGVDLAAGGKVSAAAFQITGQQGFSYSLSLPQGEFLLSSGKDEMVLKDFTSSLKENGSLTGGVAEVKIGASLNVKPNQTPGNYSSLTPMPVTVHYN